MSADALERGEFRRCLDIISPRLDTEKRLAFRKHGRSILQPALLERESIPAGVSAPGDAKSKHCPIRVDKAEVVNRILAEGRERVLHSP
jgi:hypothetical protein